MLTIHKILTANIAFLLSIVVLDLCFLLIRPDKGKNDMSRVSKLIKSSTLHFFKMIVLSIIVLDIVLGVASLKFKFFNFKIGVILGQLFSILAGLVCILCTTNGNIIIAEMAVSSKSVGGSLSSAVRVSRVMGPLLALIFLSTDLAYMIFPIKNLLYGMVYGSFTLAITTRIYGGIFTKSADISADLVGKVISNLPEDSIDNPGVIADNAGDIVGDGLGTICSLVSVYFLSFLLSIKAQISEQTHIAVILCLTLASLVWYIPILVKFNQKDYLDSCKSVSQIVIGRMNLCALLNCLVVIMCFGVSNAYWESLGGLIGILFPIISVYCAEIFTDSNSYPIRHCVKMLKDFDIGISMTYSYTYSILSTAIQLGLCLATVMIVSKFKVCPIEHIPMFMATLIPIIAATDIYGPTVDNAGGIVEIATADQSARQITDILDSAGNSTKSSTKSYIANFIITILIVCFAKRSINNFKLVFVGVLVALLLNAFITHTVMNNAMHICHYIACKIKKSDKTDSFYTNTVKQVTYSSFQVGLVPVYLLCFLSIIVRNGGFAFGFSTLSTIMGLQLSQLGAMLDNIKKSVEPMKEEIRELEGDIEKYIKDNKNSNDLVSALFRPKGDYLSLNLAKLSQMKAVLRNAICGDVHGDPIKDTTGPILLCASPMFLLFII